MYKHDPSINVGDDPYTNVGDDPKTKRACMICFFLHHHDPAVFVQGWGELKSIDKDRWKAFKCDYALGFDCHSVRDSLSNHIFCLISASSVCCVHIPSFLCILCLLCASSICSVCPSSTLCVSCLLLCVVCFAVGTYCLSVSVFLYLSVCAFMRRVCRAYWNVYV